VSSLPFTLDGVFFDLDGTLLDSALDLHGALLDLCTEQGVTPPSYEQVRPVVSRGSRAIIAVGFPGIDPERSMALVPRYLEIYEANMARHTVPFDGVESMLVGLDNAGVRWGIVTNKPGFLTDGLLPQAVPHWKPSAVVSGDTLSVTIAAMWRRATPPACSPWRCAGAISTAAIRMPGAPTSCSTAWMNSRPCLA
jgi:phosphoglycolate phosphatase-like HAD superfamily hydrolase